MPKRICGAKTGRRARLDYAMRSGDDRLMNAALRLRSRCQLPPVSGGSRCRFHGGYSTGPKTPEGKARSNAAATSGRARWVAMTISEGKPFPCGRKKGGRNLPLEEREQLACEKRRRREARILLQGVRVARRRRRVRERDKSKQG
jgi:hypothetical protein